MKKNFYFVNLGLMVGWLCCMAGCGATSSSSSSGAQSGDWFIEEGIRLENTTSTSTLRLSDNTYRTYMAGIQTATSSDGLTWTTPASVSGIMAQSGEFLRNPALLRQSDGTFLMIYEGVVNNSVMRFYRATSSDGVTFTETEGSLEMGAVMLAESDENNFISVPDLIRVNSSTLRLYFVAGGDHTETAVSTDEGMSWSREGEIAISGLDSSRIVVDPDIIQLSDGRYRLFFATPPDNRQDLSNKRIFSALSTDGRTFTLEEGARVGVEDSSQDRLDPDVVLLSDGSYRMYFGEAPSAGAEYDLKSALSP